MSPFISYELKEHIMVHVVPEVGFPAKSGARQKTGARAEKTPPIPNENTRNVLRPLGSLEHLFWLIDQNRSVHFAVTVEIAGQIEPSELRQALDRVQGRHPLLSACIKAPRESSPYFVHDSVPILLRVVYGDPRSSWESEVAKELNTPFDPSHAPLVRAVLIHAPEGVALTLVAHHSVADGLSLSYVIRDILQALSGVSLSPLPVPPSQDEAVKSISIEQQAHANSGSVGTPVHYRPKNSTAKVRGLRLPNELTASLRRRARREGTTVHGALSAAAVIAGRNSSVWRESPVRVISPMETRTKLNDGDFCAVFVATATTSFDATIV